MFGRVSVREVYFAPVILCMAMALCALITGQLANVSMSRLVMPYIETSLVITFVSLLLTLFWWVLQLACVRADAPLMIVKEKLLEKAPYLLLPAIVFPLFLANFTATKSAIPFLVGYTWDPFWAHADRLIFGDDAWRIAHHWLGDGANRLLEWFYVAVWAGALLFSVALVPLNASPRFTAKFYSAMMATWLLGGFVLAYIFSAAGPVFAHLMNSNPSDQFADMRAVLGATLTPHGPIQTGEMLLPETLHSHVAVKGGGVSAMPSMHLASVSIYICAARRTRLLVPAVLLWITIFVSSGYFGYHYWVDGIVAAGVAAICWSASEALYAPNRRLGFAFGRRFEVPSAC
jgi:membrane-associated phospholipid phosphatase